MGRANNPPTYFVRPWNDRGLWGNRLIDAPLVTALLQATIGTDYHFCHSAMNITPRGTKRLGFHQDYHHWFHENPINLAERDKWYIQILYYSNGFKRGDRNLMITPGSHRVVPTGDVTPDRLLSGECDDEAVGNWKPIGWNCQPAVWSISTLECFMVLSPNHWMPFKNFVCSWSRSSSKLAHHTAIRRRSQQSGWITPTAFRKDLSKRGLFWRLLVRKIEPTSNYSPVHCLLLDPFILETIAFYTNLMACSIVLKIMTLYHISIFMPTLWKI